MKKPIIRTCIITKEKLEKKDLFRIIRTKDGKVLIDDTYKQNGRGAYLKKDIDVINKAQKTKALNRALEIEVDDSIYLELKNLCK